MTRFLLLRGVQTIPVLFGVTIIAWALVSLAPGDAARIYARQFAAYGHPTDEEVEQARAELGLDGSLPQQYATWLSKVVRLDMGRSFETGAPVSDELRRRIWPTLQLAAGGLLVMTVLGVPLGVVAAVYRNHWPDFVARLVTITSCAFPSFLVSLLLIWLFAARLQWFPSLGRGGFEHVVLPSLALGLAGAGTFTRLVRASMLDTLSQQYVVAARARGLSNSAVVVRHALRNALIPVVTHFGLALASLIGGAAIVETVFSWPGLGKLTIDAIAARDYPVIQGIVLVCALAYVLVNLAVDIGYRFLDPRMSIEA